MKIHVKIAELILLPEEECSVNDVLLYIVLTGEMASLPITLTSDKKGIQ